VNVITDNSNAPQITTLTSFTPSPSTFTRPSIFTQTTSFTNSPTTSGPREPPFFAPNTFNVDIDEDSPARDILTLGAQYADGRPGQMTYQMLQGDRTKFT
jgi:hypothetical protein